MYSVEELTAVRRGAVSLAAVTRLVARLRELSDSAEDDIDVIARPIFSVDWSLQQSLARTKNLGSGRRFFEDKV